MTSSDTVYLATNFRGDDNTHEICAQDLDEKAWLLSGPDDGHSSGHRGAAVELLVLTSG